MNASEAAQGSVEQALDHGARLLARSPALALEQAQAVLAVLPMYPQAQLLCGQALTLLGETDPARDILERLAEREPRSAATALALGQVYALVGREAEARGQLERAIALKPALAEAYHALAALQRAAGEEEQAAHSDLAGIRAATQDPGLIAAASALNRGELAAALALLVDRPLEDIAAQRMRAEVLSRMGRLDEAERCLGALLARAPGFSAARELLARVLQARNRPAEALAEVQRLRAGQPANPSFAMLEGALHARIGHHERAGALYAEVLARYPEQPRAWVSQGHIHKTAGDLDAAIASYRRAIDQQPAFGEAWFSLANLKTVRFTPADIAAMRAALAAPGASDDDRLHLRYALGKALEDGGDHQAAFAAYTEGARIRRGQLRYDAGKMHAQCRARSAMLDPAFFADRAGGGCPERGPVFVVGLPRSGSTLVEQIIASHSQVEGLAELPHLMAVAGTLGSSPSSHLAALSALAPDERQALGEQYLALAQVHRREACPLFIDKLPNNWMHVGLIRLILPQAKVIDVRRHPLGCGFSIFRQHFARGQEWSYDLTEIGRYYRDYAMSMAAIDAALPGFVHRVSYEALVADQERETRALLDYLGLEFEEACLAYWNNRRAVRTPSAEQVRQPIYTDGLDHWRPVEAELAPLRMALGDLLDSWPDLPPSLRA
jgi:tetratricopeptide (TPR) repeat protein